MVIPKIAFIKIGSFSHINKNIEQLLTQHFSGYQLEVIDVRQDLVDIKSPVNMFFTAKDYGLDILLGRKNVWAALYGTTYIFKKIKTAIATRLSEERFTFSFQTQSLFDASVPGTPHFVYTDNTFMANKYYSGFDGMLYSRPWLELERTIYHNATLNFTMSTNVSKSIIQDYACDSNKVVCINVGNNVPLDEQVFQNKTYDGKHILFVGMDWKRKGGPELIDAFKIVLKTHPDATLTIVGCSPSLDVPNCRIVGRIPLAEVNKYYAQASVFCMPTRLEPFGIVLVEALARKLPVVATNIGAIPDFILDDENGYLVRPNDVKQLACSLCDLLADPKKCQVFGEEGHRLVMNKYTWEQVGVRIKQNIVSSQKIASDKI